MITGPDHLDRLLVDIATWASQVARSWADEDAASTMPRTGDGTGSSPNTGDPVGTLVEAGRRTDVRDRIGSHLLAAHRALRAAHLELTPRTPTRKCRCCQTEMATCAPDSSGEWTACPACEKYRRAWGSRCPDEVHQQRPKVRMCECDALSGGRCCEPGTCTDRAAEQRAGLSDRCAQRKARVWGREQQSA